MKRVLIAVVAALVLPACAILPGGGSGGENVDLTELEAEEQIARDAADEAIPLMLEAFPSFTVSYATSVVMECNLEVGVTAGVVIVLDGTGSSGDSPDRDAVSARVLEALEPVGYRAGEGISERIATRGDVQIRSTLNGLPDTGTNYAWIVHGDCLDAADDQRAALVRSFGARPVDTTAW